MQIGEQMVQSVHRRRGRRARFDPPFGSTQFQLRACKTRRAQEQFGESATMIKTTVLTPKKMQVQQKSTRKKARGITINERGSGPPKKRRQELLLGDKGKRKKHIAKKVDADNRAELSKREDKHPLINRRNELRARTQSTSTRVPLAATPLEADLVLA
uniref:Uncharacterized protein n=1 Tax=Solanum tuberosum TaxID=4113 RepID=M1DGU8_SOLTU